MRLITLQLWIAAAFGLIALVGQISDLQDLVVGLSVVYATLIVAPWFWKRSPKASLGIHAVALIGLLACIYVPFFTPKEATGVYLPSDSPCGIGGCGTYEPYYNFISAIFPYVPLTILLVLLLHAMSAAKKLP